MPSNEPVIRMPRGMLPWSMWREVWRDRARLGGELTTIAAFVVLATVGLAYSTIAHLAAWRGMSAFDPFTALDAMVPPVPWTIVLYSTHFLYFPLALLAAPRSDRGRLELLALLQAQLWLALGSFAIFLALPVEIVLVEEMRAALVSQPAWIRAQFEFVYAFDVPWNAWPSLHVSQSFLNVLAIACWALRAADRRPWLPGGSAARVAVTLLWIAWVGLVVSILTTRQHYVLDLATGLVAAAAAGLMLLRPAFRAIEAHGTEAIAAAAFGDQGYQSSPT